MENRNHQIMEMMTNPPDSTRVCTRWWWFGCAVTREEITRELDFMKEAGIGGVELQILYPVEPDDPEKNVKNHFYLSPEYFDYIAFAAEEAYKRNMTFDMTLGSSWPFGGPFVPEELSAPNVIPYTIDVEGPCEFSYDFTTRLYGKCVGCVIGRMEHSKMVPETIQDITDLVKDKYLFNWEWGKKLEKIQVPEGSYKIVIFISNDKRQTVLKPLPGGDGLIIDHDRKDALRFFLEQGGDPIEKNAGKWIRSYFCDSIEVFGQNWTDIIYEEFRKRRGYELRPYIYALWGEIEGMTDLIRYDFNKTLGELTVENFFQELTKWCHENGKTSRIQAHGTWGDILKAYGAADVPEGETFSAFDRYEVNTIHRRLASSAGHIYGKKIISNESFTWLRFPRYIVTLEIMKAAVDSIFLDGMNQIINHGYAYSPENAGHPGWSFYASSQINHENTWWKHYPHMSDYIHRVCTFLQKGKTKVPLAIYLPQPDVWAENPMSDIHIGMKLEERLTTAMVDGIQKAGFWFDYVNDEALEDLESRGYQALLLLETDRLPAESAKNIEKFAQSGKKVICKGHTPLKSCGLLKFEENSQYVKEVFNRMLEKQKCICTADSLEAVVAALNSCVEKDVVLKVHKGKIGYVHQQDVDTDIYFLSNISNEWCKEEVTFCGQTENVMVLDLMNGKTRAVSEVRKEEKGTTISLTFKPFESLVFVFGKNIQDEVTVNPAEDALKKTFTRELDISENWILNVEALHFHREYEKLESWEKNEALKYYSGSGEYEKKFVLSQADLDEMNGKKVFLGLEHLGETAAVNVNGVAAGVILMHPHMLEITGLLKTGENVLKITAENLLINQAIDPQHQPETIKETIIPQWPYNTGHLNQERAERVLNWRERQMVKEPVASGIWGKVVVRY